MVMGDASLYRNRLRNGDASGDYKLDIGHSIKQYDYLVHKRDIVNALFNYPIPINHKQVAAKKGGKTYPIVKFCTRVHPRLTQIAKHCYIDGKKRILWQDVVIEIIRKKGSDIISTKPIGHLCKIIGAK